MKAINRLLNFTKISLGIIAAICISIFGTLALSRCESTASIVGPGMIVTYVSSIRDKRIYINNSRLPDGKDFPTAGSFGYARDPLGGGATEGAAPDGRRLPEYIDFSWQEAKYPAEEQDPSLSVTEATAQVIAKFKALPTKEQRVYVRERVPQDVIDEVTESNRRKQPGKLSDKALWIYFVWTDDGIKLRWRLWYRPEIGAPSFPREGGDPLFVAQDR